jgi:hypothetical protein
VWGWRAWRRSSQSLAAAGTIEGTAQAVGLRTTKCLGRAATCR